MPFTLLFAPEPLVDALSDTAWLQAMLDVEAGLAEAQAAVGVIPAGAAEAIAACCRAERFDPAALALDARHVGSPVEPLVRALSALVPGEAARLVHLGCTSQDVMDTAAMLVAKRALALIERDLDGVGDACAGLAETHRDTLMVARTLMQHALPTTFGLKAAGWLDAVTRARGALARLAPDVLALELGGAAGTLASYGSQGPAIARELATRLGLAEAELPWHAQRGRIAELGAALSLMAGSLGKIALDVVLLSQTEVGEVAEAASGRRGGSSTLPHKRNPVGSTLVRSCARSAQASAGLLLGNLEHEHERAAGAWQAEWDALSGALLHAGAAAYWLREVLETLEVKPGRMRANLDSTRGLVMAEAVSLRLAEALGRVAAHDLLKAVSRRVADGDGTLADELAADPAVTAQLAPAELAAALDPAGYLGAASTLIDRAVSRHRGGAA